MPEKPTANYLNLFMNPLHLLTVFFSFLYGINRLTGINIQQPYLTKATHRVANSTVLYIGAKKSLILA